MDTQHRYAPVWHTDGDYVHLLVFREGMWVSATYWLIPGTQIED